MLIYLAHKMFSFTENPRENWPTQAYLENDVKIEVHAGCNYYYYYHLTASFPGQPG